MTTDKSFVFTEKAAKGKKNIQAIRKRRIHV